MMSSSSANTPGEDLTMNSHSIRSECLLPKVRASDYKSLKNDDTVDEEEDLDSSINSESTSSTGIYGSDAIGNDSVEEKTAITLSLEEPLANSIHNNTSSPSKCTATYQQPTKAENKVLIKHARLLSWASDEDGLLCIDSSEHSSLVHPQILESPRTILESPKIAGISSQQPYHLSIFHEIVRCFSMDSQDSSSTQYLSKHESSPSCNGRHRIQTSLSGIFRETSLGTAERSFIQPSQDRLRVWNQALVASIENEQNFLSSSSVLLRPDAIHRRALSVHDLFPNLRDPVRTTTTSTASTPPFGLISTNSIIQCVSNVGDYSLVKTAPSPGNAIHCRSSFKSSGTKDVFE